MINYIDILKKQQTKKQRVITEAEFLESEKNEKVLEDIEHEENKNSN